MTIFCTTYHKLNSMYLYIDYYECPEKNGFEQNIL